MIATNTAGHEVDPYIERDDLGDGAAKGLSAAEQDGRVAEPRPEASAGVAERKWITEFNNNPTLSGKRSSSGLRASASARTRRGVEEGDRYEFRDRDDNQKSSSSYPQRRVEWSRTAKRRWRCGWRTGNGDRTAAEPGRA